MKSHIFFKTFIFDNTKGIREGGGKERKKEIKKGTDLTI